MRVVFLSGVALICCALVSQSIADSNPAKAFPRQLPGLIERCLADVKASDNEEPGSQIDLEQHCPKLHSSYNTSHMSLWLAEKPGSFPTIDELQDLSRITHELHADARHTYRGNIQSLDGIVDDIYQPHAEESDWWSRFLRWLAELLKDKNENNDSWLLDFLKHFKLPEWLNLTIINTLLIVFVVLVVTFIVIELKTAGVRNWLRRGKVSVTQQAFVNFPIELSWETIGGLSANQAALACHRKLIGILQKQAIIAKDDSITNQELVHRLTGSLNPVFRDFFSHLSNTIDAIIYGGRHISKEQGDEIITGTRRHSESLKQNA